jgi:3-deoxy-D-manno-octulosonic-acid transferase
MYWLGYLAYGFGTAAYGAIVAVASFFNSKAKLFIEGRRGLLSKIANDMQQDSREKVWFHCASLGEFEQARPIIEKLKKEHSSLAVVITFFSPSGYEVRKNYSGADYIYYLPLDNNRNAQYFVSIINPVMAFFVKYEIWYHYLIALQQKSIPVFLISANFRENHIYFKWYGAFFKKMLGMFTHIFCQNEASYNRLSSAGLKQASISRDTRFDRVSENAKTVKQLPVIEKFKAGKNILIAGSSYTAEENIIATAMLSLPGWKMIIAPHHIQVERIVEIENRFAQYKVQRFSQVNEGSDLRNVQVLIIDNIGMLTAIYQYANVALIGGGFGKKGLHNTLEAVAFGMPILFGPNNLEKFPESKDMLAAGVAFVVETEKDLENKMFNWDQNPQQLNDIAALAKQFVLSQVGATQHVFNVLKPFLKKNSNI